MIDLNALANQFQELQRYVGWTAEDARRIRSLATIVQSEIPALVDDFYQEIGRHAATRRVITGGEAQIVRLKQSLETWLKELFSGTYGEEYAARHWRVGRRHFEIGLHQTYVHGALARLRSGLMRACSSGWRGAPEELVLSLESLHKLLDLDLALIEDSYHSEHRLHRQQSNDLERLAERREMQSVLQNREEQLRLLDAAIADLHEGIIITDAVLKSPGPQIVFVNSAMSRICGYSPEELLGQNPRLLQGPGTDRSLMARLRSELAAGRGFGGETINYRKDGTPYPFEFHVAPVRNEEGNVTHFVATHRDVSERRRTHDRLMQSERLAAIGRAMAGLAHESRNALQRGQSNLERLARRVNDHPEAMQLIARIQQAQDDLHRLYEEVREYSAPLRIAPQVGRLDECLFDAWEQLSVIRETRTARMLEEKHRTDLQCEFDSFALSQVFRNILLNALEACEDPVEIEVAYRETELTNRPTISVAIRDNGPGLGPEQDQIFDEFYTTKTHGTGLGLAIAKRLVEAHSGRITAGSSPRGGAEIIVSLPRKQA